MADQPAPGPDGQLLDTLKIQWYNDPDNAHPIQQAASKAQRGIVISTNSLITA
jgi:hypothetical protein